MNKDSRFETVSSDHIANLSRKNNAGNRPDARLHKMIADMRRFVSHLESEIAMEEDRAKVHDEGNFAYPIVAKTMRARRDNLNLTIAALDAQVQSADRGVSNKLEIRETASAA